MRTRDLYVAGGLLGASWGPFGALSGLPGGFLGASWGLLGSQDGAQGGQVGPKLRSRGTLEPCWRQLGGNLPEDAVMMPSWSRLGGNLEATWPNLGRFKSQE